jgi:hypothetical protein
MSGEELSDRLRQLSRERLEKIVYTIYREVDFIYDWTSQSFESHYFDCDRDEYRYNRRDVEGF